MAKRSRESDDPSISAKRALDQIISQHDPESVSKAKAVKPQIQTAKKPEKRRDYFVRFAVIHKAGAIAVNKL